MQIKSKHILYFALFSTITVTLIICYNFFVLDIKIEKVGPFPYPINKKMFGEANEEYQKIVELGKKIISYDDFSEAEYKKKPDSETSDDEIRELYIQKHHNVLEEFNKLEYSEIILPITINNNNNEDLGALVNLYKLVFYNIENDIINNKIELAVNHTIKVNRQINDFGEKAPTLISGIIFEGLKSFELKNIINIVKNENSTITQKLNILKLDHHRISKETLIKCIYNFEFTNNPEPMETLNMLCEDAFFFKFQKLINPNFSYSYKPNLTTVLRREFLKKIVNHLEDKKTYKDFNDLDDAYSIFSPKKISDYEPNAFGKREAIADAETLLTLLRIEIKKNNTIKQIQIAKAIIEYKEQNGYLPKSLSDLNLEPHAIIDNVSCKPFIYLNEYGALQRICRQKDKSIEDKIKGKTLSEEEFKKIKEDYYEEVIFFK